MSHSEKLQNLIAEVKEKIMLMIRDKGEQSDFGFIGNKCLKITDEDFMFNLDGRKYLSEVIYNNNNIEFVDNYGYNYFYHVLDSEKFVQVADYLIKKYECDHSLVDETNDECYECDHSLVDETNDGCYGTEVCRICGQRFKDGNLIPETDVEDN
jgi:hypothetical protein